MADPAALTWATMEFGNVTLRRDRADAETWASLGHDRGRRVVMVVTPEFVAGARADEGDRALLEAAEHLDGRWTRNIGGHPYSDRDRGIREAVRVVRALARPADPEGA